LKTDVCAIFNFSRRDRSLEEYREFRSPTSNVSPFAADYAIAVALLSGGRERRDYPRTIMSRAASRLAGVRIGISNASRGNCARHGLCYKDRARLAVRTAARDERRKTKAAIREMGEGDRWWREANFAFHTCVIGHAPDSVWSAHSSELDVLFAIVGCQESLPEACVLEMFSGFLRCFFSMLYEACLINWKFSGANDWQKLKSGIKVIYSLVLFSIRFTVAWEYGIFENLADKTACWPSASVNARVENTRFDRECVFYSLQLPASISRNKRSFTKSKYRVALSIYRNNTVGLDFLYRFFKANYFDDL